MSLTSVQQRFNTCLTEIDELLNDEIITVENNQISINFLDEQFSEFEELRKKKSKAGKASYKIRKGNTRSTRVQQVFNKEDKIREDKIREDKDKSFDLFWDHYHSITGKPKTDKEPCYKYWKKLTENERSKAYDMTEKYKRSVKDAKYIKKARTYLADKNFNDELRPVKVEPKRPAYQRL